MIIVEYSIMTGMNIYCDLTKKTLKARQEITQRGAMMTSRKSKKKRK